jgi:hypothetical protein
MKQIIGAIYPVTTEQASNIFDKGKTVFVKFTKMTNLKPNSKIIFYVTKEKVLYGEATIRSANRMSPLEVWGKYGKDLFLNQDEYERYSNWSSVEKKSRTNTELTVFVLKNLNRYKHSPLFRGITPSGRYLSEEEYCKITS